MNKYYGIAEQNHIFSAYFKLNLSKNKWIQLFKFLKVAPQKNHPVYTIMFFLRVFFTDHSNFVRKLLPSNERFHFFYSNEWVSTSRLRVHWESYISISFHIEWNMIMVIVFLSILNQIEFHFVQNRKENCHHDHIPFNLKGNRIQVFLVNVINLSP